MKGYEYFKIQKLSHLDMSNLHERIFNLSREIEEFPLGQCSPSDDPDKQTAYLFAFRDLVKRFISSVRRIDNTELQQMIYQINPSPDHITDAYDLKADLQGIIDFIGDAKLINNNRPGEMEIELTGWDRIERSVNEIKIKLQAAENEEQFQAVGLTCRETIISLAQQVYKKEVHQSSDGVEPS